MNPPVESSVQCSKSVEAHDPRSYLGPISSSVLTTVLIPSEQAVKQVVQNYTDQPCAKMRLIHLEHLDYSMISDEWSMCCSHSDTVQNTYFSLKPYIQVLHLIVANNFKSTGLFHLFLVRHSSDFFSSCVSTGLHSAHWI